MVPKFKTKTFLLLLIILLLGLFFRTYDPIGRFNYDHDSELFSWIAKDIIVNHHPRLIGQLTSAPGVFIGSFYYYLNVPFFLLTNMDPLGAVIPITIIGLLTILSYYIVFSKLFNRSVGLISSFLYAVLLSNVGFDRRVVPSTLTNIWLIWYFYAILMMTRGNYSVLPILGILIGLIWHIHIALLPTLIAIPAAMFLSKKLPSIKQVIYFLTTLFITSLPLLIFEARHNFQQTKSLIENFTTSHGGSTGIDKLFLVLEMITKNINNLLFAPRPPTFIHFSIPIIILSSAILLVRKKILTLKEVITFYIWTGGVVIFFTLSSSPISEYYFASIEIIFTAILSLYLWFFYRSSKIGKIVVISLLTLVAIKNIYFFTTDYIYHKGYVERKAVADFITSDSKEKGYPCVGISYITAIGENVGFRYFFWLNKLHTIKPTADIPVYNIVIPDELSKEVEKKFGHIGIITPKNEINMQKLQRDCQGENTNLTEPLFGYTE